MHPEQRIPPEITQGQGNLSTFKLLATLQHGDSIVFCMFR